MRLSRPTVLNEERARPIEGDNMTPTRQGDGVVESRVRRLIRTKEALLMRSTRRPLALLLGLTALLTLGILLPDLSAAQGPKRGGILRVSYGNEIANLDFHTAPGYEMMWVAMNVGCGLINITPEGKFVADAAESWQVSPDGRLYTFKLKKNVLFHDGTPVDAAAVKFSIDRIRDPETKSGMRTFFEAVQSVEVVDPSTVQVHLKYPYAFFLHMLAGYRTGLVISNPVA